VAPQRANAIHCPADPNETAEAYAFGTLVGPDALVFEEHLLVCERCRAALDSTEQYARTMHNASKRLRIAEKK